MFYKRKISRKKPSLIRLTIEQLEERLSPAVIVTDRYGEATGGVPYDMTQAYRNNLPPGTTPADYAQATFAGAYQPAAYFTTVANTQ